MHHVNGSYNLNFFISVSFSAKMSQLLEAILILHKNSTHASTSIPAFTKDCSIRVICAHFMFQETA